MFPELNSLCQSNFFTQKFLPVLTLIFFCLQFAYSQTSATLELNKPIENEISAKEIQTFQITLAENQYASVTIEQRGIDVAVRVLGTDKKAFVQRDSILKTEGQEKVEFVALMAGIYFLEIEAKPNPTATGHYQIVLAEMRPSTEKERNLEKARKLHNESVQLWGDGEYQEALAKLLTLIRNS